MSDLKQMKESLNGLPINVVLFPDFITPYGMLNSDRASHALFYYYICAMKTYETNIANDPLVYEGHADPTQNFHQLFTSIATMYNVSPDQMANYWDLVDAQCDLMEFPRIPDEERYRHNRAIKISIN